MNLLPLIGGVVILAGGMLLTFIVWFYFSPKHLQVGYAPKQPVPYSHRLHAGELGIDCRYCHYSVENSAEAAIPSTQTCMGCHSAIKTGSARLEPVRESWKTGKPIEWVRVHKVADHAYFDHSVHVSAGVGCVSCHGRIDQMEVVRLDKPLSMGWCLDCHRNPGPNLRPPDQVTNMRWKPEAGWVANVQAVHPPEHCSGCHR